MSCTTQIQLRCSSPRSIKKITFAGDVVKDDEFYLGVLRDGELR